MIFLWLNVIIFYIVINQMPVSIKCKELLEDLQLSICIDSRTIVRDTIPIAALIEMFLLQNKSGKRYVIIDQVCTLTLYWNGAMQITSLGKPSNQAFLISTNNRITFENFKAKAVVANCRSVHFLAQVQIKHFLFQYCLFEMREKSFKKVIDSKQYKEQEQLLSVGRVKIRAQSEIKVQQFRLLKGDLIIETKARLMIYSQDKYVLDLAKSRLKIYPKGKIISDKPLIIMVNQVQNWGYIYSNPTTKVSAAITIISKSFINHGLLKNPLLAIRSKRLENTEKAKIDYEKGTLFIENTLENKGIIAGHTFIMKESSKEAVSLINYGQISCKHISIESNYVKNHNIISAIDISIVGKTQNQGLFSNKGQIVPLNNLLIRNIILQMTPKSSIISNGNLKVDIEILLNSGNILANKQSVISVKDLICNRGSLNLKEAYVKGGTLTNHHKIVIEKSSNIEIKDLFYNTGNIHLQNATIHTKNLLSSGSLHLSGTNYIGAELISVAEINTDVLHLNGLYLDIQGKGLVAKQAFIEAKHITNKGQIFQVNQLSMKAITFDNQSVFVIRESGQISLSTQMFDSQSALTFLNNVKLKTHGSVNTSGKIYLQNVVFEGVKYFANTKEVSIINGDYHFDCFHHNKLNINNTHVTTGLYEGKEIHCEGGSTGIHQRERTKHISSQCNEFVLSIQSQQFAKSVKIYLHDIPSFKKAVTSDLNGYYFLDSPFVYGDFIKSFYAKHFDLPGNNYQNYLHKNQSSFKNMIKLHDKKSYLLPKNQQKALNIELEGQCRFRGNVKYQGNLSLKSKKLEIYDGKVLVQDGLLHLSAEEGLRMIECYVKAKGINIEADKMEEQGGRYLAGLQGIAIKANSISSKPIITRHTKISHQGNSETTRKFQKGKQSLYKSQGNIVVEAGELIHMISPQLYAKKDIILQADTILIQGMFLLNEKTTTVNKDTFWGGQKTNTYYARNDKPLKAEISAQNIYLRGKNAFLNATIKGKKLYDLTEKGVRLFFVIGFKGSAQNRQFGNAVTQGVEGYSYTRQKLLKTDLKQLNEFYRPPQLGGVMIFDSVDWDKQKTKVTGAFKENVYKCKSWYQSWHSESLAPGVSIVIAIAASFVGANFIAPYFTQGVVAWKAALIKAGFSTLTQRFALSIAANGGNFQKAMREFMSLNTVRALAFNIASAGINNWLCNKLEIKLSDSVGSIFKQATIRHATNFTLDGLINNHFPTKLNELVLPFIADVFGQFSSKQIGNMYRTDQIGYLTHKALHGISGGFLGLLLSGTCKGAASGALGAVFAEIAFQAMVPEGDMQKKSEKIFNRMKSGQSFEFFDLGKQIQLQVTLATIIGTIVGGTVTGDWSAARFCSQNAVQNNGLYTFLQWGKEKVVKFFQNLLKLANQFGLKEWGKEKIVNCLQDVLKKPIQFGVKQGDENVQQKLFTKDQRQNIIHTKNLLSNVINYMKNPLLIDKQELGRKISNVKFDLSFIYAVGSFCVSIKSVQLLLKFAKTNVGIYTGILFSLGGFLKQLQAPAPMMNNMEDTEKWKQFDTEKWKQFQQAYLLKRGPAPMMNDMKDKDEKWKQFQARQPVIISQEQAERRNTKWKQFQACLPPPILR